MSEQRDSAIFDDNDYDRLSRELFGVTQLLGALISCGSEIEAYPIEVLQTVLDGWSARAGAACKEFAERLSKPSATAAAPAM